MKYKPSFKDFCWGIGSIPMFLYYIPPILFWEHEDEFSNIQGTICLFWFCLVSGGFFFINLIFGFVMVLYFVLGMIAIVKFSDNYNEFWEWVTTKKPFQLKFEGYWKFKYKRNGILDSRWLEDNKRMTKWKEVERDED